MSKKEGRLFPSPFCYSFFFLTPLPRKLWGWFSNGCLMRWCLWLYNSGALLSSCSACVCVVFFLLPSVFTLIKSQGPALLYFALIEPELFTFLNMHKESTALHSKSILSASLSNSAFQIENTASVERLKRMFSL